MLQGIIERIRRIKAELIANREADVLRIAFDQVALIKLRIQTKGESADGPLFVPYVEPYKRSRQKAGYQVGFVDFTRTGRMWANVQPRIESSNMFSATVIIEGSEQRSKDIVAGAAKKRGNILRPSAAEIQLVRNANRARLEKYLNA